jgi:SPX domain protein involved in polyphosphate accumulation
MIDKGLDEVGDDIVELDSFQRLNVHAFSHLLDKHDKWRAVPGKLWFMLRMQKQNIFKKDCDHVLRELSESWKMYNQLNRKERRREEMGNIPAAQNFERKTTKVSKVFLFLIFKYWIRGDKIMQLKCLVVKYLPIDVFEKSSKRTNPMTTSVYLDSPNLNLYHQRMKKEEGAISIRLRTYGDGDPKGKTVFVEKKTHHDAWVGEASVKTRFSIKVTNYISFLINSRKNICTVTCKENTASKKHCEKSKRLNF